MCVCVCACVLCVCVLCVVCECLLVRKLNEKAHIHAHTQRIEYLHTPSLARASTNTAPTRVLPGAFAKSCRNSCGLCVVESLGLVLKTNKTEQDVVCVKRGMVVEWVFVVVSGFVCCYQGWLLRVSV